MLRIDPRVNGTQPFAVPPDNPFIGRADARPAIWAYGLRNPWRYSFDRRRAIPGSPTWDRTTGRRSTSSPRRRRVARTTGGTSSKGAIRSLGDTLPGGVAPVYEYSHAEGGCTVIGGYVYRGTGDPGAHGRVPVRRPLHRGDRGDPRPGRSGHGTPIARPRRPQPQLVRRGRAGRALRDVAERRVATVSRPPSDDAPAPGPVVRSARCRTMIRRRRRPSRSRVRDPRDARLAMLHDAINLSQGFPDFAAPED